MFEKLKKAFGFGETEENDDLIQDDPELQTGSVSPFSSEKAESNVKHADIDNTTADIFEHVVEKFNEALPDFLKSSVDTEKERKFLYDTLSDDIKRRLKDLEASVTHQLDEAWRNEREKLQSDIKNISQTAKDIEAKRAELKSQQLSSDRQKRAMTERIHELEKQLLASEAEKEQLELENKSMLNKVKVAQVYEKDMEAMREQIDRLQSELNTRQFSVSSDTENKESPMTDDLIAELTELRKKVEDLTQENGTLQSSNKELKKVETEYNSLITKMEQIDTQLSKLDEIISKKDSKIESLKAQIEDAQKDMELKDKEINALKTDLAKINSENAENTEITNHDHSGDVLTDDDILNDTDWTVQPSSNSKNNSKSRFERSKPKKNQPIDDGQMSLW